MMDIDIWEVCYFFENLSKKQGLINQIENDHLTSPSQPQWKELEGNIWKEESNFGIKASCSVTGSVITAL